MNRRLEERLMEIQKDLNDERSMKERLERCLNKIQMDFNTFRRDCDEGEILNDQLRTNQNGLMNKMQSKDKVRKYIVISGL
jgi:hypothetical protein